MKSIKEFLDEALDGNSLFNDKIKYIISLNNKNKQEEAVKEGLSLIGTKESLRLKKSISSKSLDDIKEEMMKLAKKIMDVFHYKKFFNAFPSQTKKPSKKINQLNGDDFRKLDKLDKSINTLINKLMKSNLHKEQGFKEAITNILKRISI